MNPTLTALLTALCIATAARADGRAGALPRELRPFAPLAESCFRWHTRHGAMFWAHHNNEPFDRERGNWKPALLGGSAEKIRGRPELLVKAPIGGTVLVPVGPAVRGPLAVEMVARASDEAAPLGIMLDQPSGKGPGFVFGSRPAGQHLLWSDRNSGDAVFVPVDAGAEPGMVVGQDHRVRLEIRDGKVWGYVDGKLVGSTPLGRGYDLGKLRQPMIMTTDSSITVKSVTTEKYMPNRDAGARRAADEATWKELFGAATPKQLEAQAGKLVPLLGHEQWAVRERSGEMIRDIGEFALPALRQAALSDFPELRIRARQLLGELEPSPPGSHDMPE